MEKVKTFNTITLKDFLKYTNFKESGNFNMVMQGREVAAKIGISIEKYKYIRENYDFLVKIFLA